MHGSLLQARKALGNTVGSPCAGVDQPLHAAADACEHTDPVKLGMLSMKSSRVLSRAPLGKYLLQVIVKLRDGASIGA